MADNTIKNTTGKSIDIYETDIQALFDTYITSLDDVLEKPDIQIYRNPIFKGALKYIYNNLFKIKDTDIKYNNKTSNIDYSDIYTLDAIWDIYTSLCYKYRQSPTLLNFSIMTGIDNATFSSWANAEYRNNGGKLGSPHCQTVKKWKSECEAAAYDLALSGNPGGMFALKANYGYTETAPAQVPYSGDIHKSIEQIAQEHGIKSLTTTDNADIVDIPKAEF